MCCCRPQVACCCPRPVFPGESGFRQRLCCLCQKGRCRRRAVHPGSAHLMEVPESSVIWPVTMLVELSSLLLPLPQAARERARAEAQTTERMGFIFIKKDSFRFVLSIGYRANLKGTLKNGTNGKKSPRRRGTVWERSYWVYSCARSCRTSWVRSSSGWWAFAKVRTSSTRAEKAERMAAFRATSR